ncbi:hypothetical protein F5Y00DRAFT_264451 [Daldinia vernicosa]|uniref:uncharacterized protein n=1 Tax=Daldinia vernicosa TaxID=114800 RepID=UPI0020081769|nr:uncharacterized protein F5Y00DRAFT_264451 [Daldinia vernicosa]KAI0846640.1 hypothetical protein F5Y00DRAFT_264451 [Daldinia vernicosa]
MSGPSNPGSLRATGQSQVPSNKSSTKIPVTDRVKRVPKPSHPLLRQLVDFYHPMLAGPDWKGRYFDRLLDLPTEDYDGPTDFIGWLFPLPERVGAETSPEAAAPVLDQLAFMYMRQEEAIGQNLKLALIRILDIYGFNIQYTKHSTTEVPVITELSGGKGKFQFWGTTLSHHHERIARIIRSTRILGYESMGLAIMRAFHKAVKDWDLFGSWPAQTALAVLDSWRRAGESPLQEALDGKTYAPWLSKHWNSNF